MARFAGLKTPYALFIITLMVLGVIAAGFYFYSSASQNPCGDPGDASFTSAYQTTVDVNGQPKQFNAVDAAFTKVQQNDAVGNVKFVVTGFDDPSQPHLVNGHCVSDTFTPASITIRVTFTSNGQQEYLSLSYKGSLQYPTEAFTSNSQAGLQWRLGSISIVLLSAI